MTPKIRIGRLRIFKTNKWDNKETMRIEFFTIEIDLKYKFICLTILNFEFEIDW